MAECTDSERRLLDHMNEADAVLVYHDAGPSTIAWLKSLSGRPPLKFTVDYGHVDGERMVRRLQLTLGLTQKQFDAAVQRGREEG